ncbi:glycosyltransferase family 87 protein [Bradyrhizobium guangzhouense]|uniref:glycosyltransferase family 87 protein n=1 Tax=Bradyrhizobium guangzhouense TaxID=1325095 RepID=UPI001FE005D3|nr:glycosyltransferase family 87 protein [Bradyrhizobium guangzhouense]
MSSSKRTAYVRFVMAALAVMVLFKTLRFGRWGVLQIRELSDFDAFYIAAQQVWRGQVDLVYRFETLMKLQAEAAHGATGFMPWTYPPQFNLLVAPLALLPTGIAYLLFIAATLAAYLLTLRAIAGASFAHVLVALFPALAITIGGGQNGFLTGALVGLVCLNVERRQLVAGLALGAMVVKPHLAIAVGVYMLATRRWMALATAAAVVLASSVVCTMVFGWQIWTAWLGAIRESASFLEQGIYPLLRMISTYAALSRAGVPPAIAFWAQAAVASLALGAVVLAVRLGAARNMSPRFALGITAMVSVMISPYAYDYDLPMVGIGLAMLLPNLALLASARERSVIYGLILLAGAYGMLQSARLAAQFGEEQAYLAGLTDRFAPALGGFAMMALLVLLLRLLWRGMQSAAVLPQAAEAAE